MVTECGELRLAKAAAVIEDVADLLGQLDRVELRADHCGGQLLQGGRVRAQRSLPACPGRIRLSAMLPEGYRCSIMATARDSKDVRWAKLANVLAEAARAGRVDPQDARTVLVHALRVRQNNAKLQIRPRSRGAQASIDKYAPDPPPPNGSPDSLHADHVYCFPHTGPKLSEFFSHVTTVDAWLHELRRLDQVVCLTAAENETVRRVEADFTGPEKYDRAGIAFADPTPWDKRGTMPSRAEPLRE